MEQLECSETSAYINQTPGNHPKENKQQSKCALYFELSSHQMCSSHNTFIWWPWGPRPELCQLTYSRPGRTAVAQYKKASSQGWLQPALARIRKLSAGSRSARLQAQTVSRTGPWSIFSSERNPTWPPFSMQLTSPITSLECGSKFEWSLSLNRGRIRHCPHPLSPLVCGILQGCLRMTTTVLQQLTIFIARRLVVQLAIQRVVEICALFSQAEVHWFHKPNQSSNWGAEICTKRKSMSPCLLVIPAFDRKSGLNNRHLNS